MSLPEPYYDDGGGRVIYHGDCREILPLLEQVDMVFTDPPYPREFEHVWQYFGLIKLKKGRSLMSYCGHYQLPLALTSIGKHFRWHWLCIQQNAGGINPIMHGFRVKVNFKPVLWFTNGKPDLQSLPIVDDDLGRLGKS